MREWAELMTMFAMGAAVLGLIIHIMFAIGVARDARERERAGGETEFVGSLTWCIATLLGGVFVAGVYWLMHRSSLRGQWTA